MRASNRRVTSGWPDSCSKASARSEAVASWRASGHAPQRFASAWSASCSFCQSSASSCCGHLAGETWPRQAQPRQLARPHPQQLVVATATHIATACNQQSAHASVCWLMLSQLEQHPKGSNMQCYNQLVEFLQRHDNQQKAAIVHSSFLALKARHPGGRRCQVHMGSLAGATHLLKDNTGVARCAQREQQSRVKQKGKKSSLRPESKTYVSL